MSEISDDILLKRLRSGDHSVYDALYRKYFKVLTLEAECVVCSWQAAKDVVQGTFLIWLENDTLKTLSRKENIKLKAYLKQSVRIQALRYLGKERNKMRRETIAHRLDEQIVEIVHSMDDIDFVIREFIDGLNPMPKNMLTERYMNEYKVDEIASGYGISPKKVRNYLYNGLKALRFKLIGKADHLY